MKPGFSFLLAALVFAALAAACAPGTPSTPIVSTIPVMPSPTVTPEPTAMPLSFKPATYKAEGYAFELDYPEGWTAVPISEIGSRGSQGQLLSPGASAESLPPGTTRVAITVYLWDPKQDLDAYVEHRRTAWEASGASVVKESSGDLADGRTYKSFVVQASDGFQDFFQYTTLGDKYLEIAGRGDLALVEEIAHTLRPVGLQP